MIVLSNNDGCAVARTDEAKALGIEMGAPFFKIKELVEKHKVHVFSSNYSLYGDMSRRVMALLRDFTPALEIYSIDEAFLDLTGFTSRDLVAYAHEIRAVILKQTGIPVSIGLAPTKVLAKVANRLSKKNKVETQGVFSLLDPEAQARALEKFPVQDIWGIGRKSAQKLHELKIFTAKELRDADEQVIQKRLTIVGARIVKELRGSSCISLEQIIREKKSICSSRSFGSPIFRLEELQEAVANHVHNAAEKLRRDASIARAITVFVQTNRYKNVPQYANSATQELLSGSSSTPKLIRQAYSALSAIFQEGYEYKKCGVILSDFVAKKDSQFDFFGTADSPQEDALMQTMDSINLREGKGTVKPAACGMNPLGRSLSEMRSQSFTTRWSELLTVK